MNNVIILKSIVKKLQIKLDNKDLGFVYYEHVLMLIGYSYILLEDLGNAIEYLEKLLKFNPDNAQALSASGYVYYMQKAYKKAIKNYAEKLKSLI